MVNYEADSAKIQAAIDVYATTVQYAQDLQASILSNYNSLIGEADKIEQSNSDSTMNRQKTNFVLSQRSTFILVDALLTTLLFTLGIVFAYAYVWPNPYSFARWASLFAIILSPYIIRQTISLTSSYTPTNIYALWAKT